MNIIFTLDGQQYATPIHEIREVIPLPWNFTELPSTSTARTLSRIPGAEGWIKGITNLRGRLVTLIDLAFFFGFPDNNFSIKKWVLIVELDSICCGLIVDSVQGIRQFDMACYRNSIPNSLPEPLHCYMAGSYHHQKEYPVFSFKAFIDRNYLLKVDPVTTASRKRLG